MPRMELDCTYNDKEHGRTLRYCIGVEARGEKETWKTENNMEEDGRRGKIYSWVENKGECESCCSEPEFVENKCQNLMCHIIRRDMMMMVMTRKSDTCIRNPI